MSARRTAIALPRTNRQTTSDDWPPTVFLSLKRGQGVSFVCFLLKWDQVQSSNESETSGARFSFSRVLLAQDRTGVTFGSLEVNVSEIRTSSSRDMRGLEKV
jgi:hypothetical protein